MPVPQHVLDNERVPTDVTTDAVRLDDDFTGVSDKRIEQAIASTSLDKHFDGARARWEVVVWDRKSPINDCPAEVVIERNNIADHNGDVYMLVNRETGRPEILQPRAPYGGDVIPAGEGETTGNKHADELAGHVAFEAAIYEIREKLRK